MVLMKVGERSREVWAEISSGYASSAEHDALFIVAFRANLPFKVEAF